MMEYKHLLHIHLVSILYPHSLLFVSKKWYNLSPTYISSGESPKKRRGLGLRCEGFEFGREPIWEWLWGLGYNRIFWDLSYVYFFEKMTSPCWEGSHFLGNFFPLINSKFAIRHKFIMHQSRNRGNIFEHLKLSEYDYPFPIIDCTNFNLTTYA